MTKVIEPTRPDSLKESSSPEHTSSTARDSRPERGGPDVDDLVKRMRLMQLGSGEKDGIYGRVADTIESLRKDLAAEQAYSQQLRDAMDTGDRDCIRTALSAPHDHTALDKACKRYAAEILRSFGPRGRQLPSDWLMDKADQLHKEAE